MTPSDGWSFDGFNWWFFSVNQISGFSHVDFTFSKHLPTSKETIRFMNPTENKQHMLQRHLKFIRVTVVCTEWNIYFLCHLSLSLRDEESRSYTIKHICVGSHSRGCTITICCCYGNQFSLEVSDEPFTHWGGVAVSALSRRGRSPLAVLQHFFFN